MAADDPGSSPFATSGGAFELGAVFLAGRLDQLVEAFGAGAEPSQGLFVGHVVLGVARLDVGFDQAAEPGAVACLFPRLGLEQARLAAFGQGAQELDVVGGRAVVGQRQQQRSIGMLDRLVQLKCSMSMKSLGTVSVEANHVVLGER